MARNVNLTEKLGLEGKPTITIGDLHLTVDNSAKTMLRIAAISTEEAGLAAIDDIAELIFGKSGKKELDKLELSFADYSTVIDAATDLIMGGSEGEAETLDTTS